MRRRGASTWAGAAAALAAWGAAAAACDRCERDDFGAIVRGDRESPRLALVFTGDEHGEGAPAILDALQQRRLRASFFLTGRFLRNEAFGPHVARIVGEGHYLGPHSDGHLLYAPWDDRQSSLVTREELQDDLQRNLAEVRAAGVGDPSAASYFIPPYEWYNRDHVAWSRELGVEVVNYTPGPRSHRDYAREGDPAFAPAEEILAGILSFADADPAGLRGAIVLLHIGSGRRDPFHRLLGRLCDELLTRGYEPVRIDELLAAAPTQSPSR